MKTVWTLSSSCRLLLLAGLLVGLLAFTGAMSRTAHAQSAATISVTTCDESHLDGAIASASSGDTITFGCSGDVALTQTLTINQNLTLDGSGQSVTLDGGNSVKVLAVSSGVTFTLNALTVAHGAAPGSNGGGLDNKGGTVSINNSTFTGNSDITGGGGGIYNDIGSTVSINNSTFANNSTSHEGGAIGNFEGTVSISNSTFANNSADTGSGVNSYSGNVSISNSTFANNSVNYGGSLHTISSTVNISGSIVANNSGGNCLQQNGTFTDQGYNLENGTDCGFTGTGSLQNTDPKLDPAGLQNNGGPTQTIALQQGSPAIDQIPVAKCPKSDQRGTNRPDDAESSCDIGAYESNYLPDSDLALTNMPANITTNATGPQGAVVTYTPPTVVDEDSPLPPVTCTPTSGSTFPIGTTTVTCTVSDSDDTPSTVTASFTVTVNDTDLALTNVPANITTNATSSQGAVVTYTPPTVVDEDSPLPQVTCTPASGSTFPIGMTTVTCTVSDSDDTPSTVTASFSVTVQPVLSATGSSVTATEGSSFSGVVATGTAYGTSNPLSATITWGDGNSSAGSVTLNGDGTYSVSGNHTYAEEGSYPLSVTVKDSGSLSATATGTAKVADAALTLTHIIAGPLGHRLAGIAATFTDADPAGQVSDYTATVNWGDGTTSTVKVVNNPLGKGFALAADHSYASKGTYTLTLTITDQGGSQVSKSSIVTVK